MVGREGDIRKGRRIEDVGCVAGERIRGSMYGGMHKLGGGKRVARNGGGGFGGGGRGGRKMKW